MSCPLCKFFRRKVGRTASTESPTRCGDRACRVRKMQARVRCVRSACEPLRRSCVSGCPRHPLRRSRVSSARNAGESAIHLVPAQPSAEIVRVDECTKCRRKCDLPVARATLCGDRACRVREMQARVRFAICPRNPLRRSCVSSARNAGKSASCPHNPLRRSCVSSARHAGESAMCGVPAQPSAEILRVECAKCRRKGDLHAVLGTLCRDCA